MANAGRLRIGELSRRTGESPELLRAWETRYGLVEPERTQGGLRLYSEADEQRVRTMRHHISAGLSASEAARLAKQADDQASDEPSTTPADVEAELERSFDALDEPAAQAALDRLLIKFGLHQALAEVILPFLDRLGMRWASAETSVAQEHFASNIIGGRLRALARGWGQGVGPRAILACPPGELHELGLLSFGLALRELGWRITYLGADTPLADITAALDELAPAIVVLAAVTPQRFLDSADELTELAAQARVGLAGAGASPDLASRLGAESLAGALVDVATALSP
ncbi:MAG: MerR family transcriptional regulator [Actinomycetota bacterium]|nr:MerR family transcriptional regulator [Actinomycetota bacterium]